jgi:hypothetical protein
MNTRRVSAAMGLGLTLVLASGCSGDSSKKDAGTGNRDGSGRDLSIGRDTASAGSCEYGGQTYQPGESFTINCVRYTCQGDNNVTASGTPCFDAGPDTRRASDAPVGSEVGRADTARDVTPAEAGRPDVTPPLDAEAIDAEAREDTTPPHTDTAVPGEDTAPTTPDVGTEDLVPPVQCTYGGQKYGVGVTFQCDCNTCKCDDTGAVVLVTHDDCTIDAG